MRILVTGGAGYLGRPLAERLVADRHTVLVLDRILPDIEGVECVQADIARDYMFGGLKGMEAVLHLAGTGNVNAVRSNPVGAVADTVLGTAMMLDMCRRAGVRRFILASSTYVYNRQGGIYATAKKCCESLCRDFRTLYSLPFTILRYGTVYGGGGRSAIDAFVKQALAGEPLTVHGTGKQTRRFLYIDDATEASVRAMGQEAEGRTCTLVGRKSVSVLEAAELVSEMTGGAEIRREPEREDDFVERIPREETPLLLPELGNWRPEIGIREGVRRTIEWHRKQSAS